MTKSHSEPWEVNLGVEKVRGMFLCYTNNILVPNIPSGKNEAERAALELEKIIWKNRTDKTGLTTPTFNQRQIDADFRYEPSYPLPPVIRKPVANKTSLSEPDFREEPQRNAPRVTNLTERSTPLETPSFLENSPMKKTKAQKKVHILTLHPGVNYNTPSALRKRKLNPVNTNLTTVAT